MSNCNLFLIFIVAGILLSLNPFNIALFSALLAGSFGKGHNTNTIHGTAVAFLLTYAACIALLGMALLEALSSISISLLDHLGLVVAVMMVIWGLVILKDFFWYRSGKAVPRKLHGLLHIYTVKQNDPLGATILGFLAALISLLSTGLAVIGFAVITALLRPFSPAWMLLLAGILLIPLVLIFIHGLRGLKISAIIKWKEDNKAIMRLSIGLTHIVLGWIILLLLNGTLGSVL